MGEATLQVCEVASSIYDEIDKLVCNSIHEVGNRIEGYQRESGIHLKVIPKYQV